MHAHTHTCTHTHTHANMHVHAHTHRRMDTVQVTGSPSLPLLSSPVLPIWPHIQNTVCNSSDYQSSSSVLHEPCPDFLDMLDSEVGNTVEVTDSATGIKNEDNSPERPKMYPHKLY